ncbi:SRPBCC family protein [Catenulispora sp. NL8]|uniref:SRPBCC family protein n=1 Tax=Catenulispora pinistramenti TaxID=2705254 RepID=A0ABS5KJ85_9ACTN|nr:SRPBCC family protein [Catenulispora pinistramenti]MBS2546459.1 SRPBCC family protein [Catenulispora pinistramenti]
MYATRPVDLDFLNEAPLRLSFAHTLQAAPKAVFDAIAHDVATLPRWYGAVATAEYGGPEPFGVGTRRRVKLVGGVAFHERILAWDSPVRYAYRVEHTNVPGIRAMAEEWSVLDTPAGTRVAWTMAVDAVLPVAATFRASAPGMAVATRRALGRLDRMLAA